MNLATTAIETVNATAGASWLSTQSQQAATALLPIFTQGFLLQASLILALGAQNIFVLNSGLRRQQHTLVALVSSVCDTLLVMIGVLGVATIFIQVPALKIGLGVLGVGFLFIYGALKIKEGFRGNTSNPTQPMIAVTRRQAILTSLGFSLLNPHVYLDTVVLIGGYSAKFAHASERLVFGAGASLFSTIWFFGLALLAAQAQRILRNEHALRRVSLVSGLILISLSVKLGRDVWDWISISHT